MEVKNIIIIHGWKVDTDRYKGLSNTLKKEKLRVFVPTLPGFDQNVSVKDRPLQLDDYAKFLSDYIKSNNIESFVVIAHSFGGRVLVKFLNKHRETIKTNKLLGIILTGTPLVKEDFGFRKRIGILLSTVGRKFFPRNQERSLIEEFFRKILYRIIGEWDYCNAGTLKKTFINVIGENLEPYLQYVNLPTLILWGKYDKITKVEIGFKIHTRIKNSIFFALDGGHDLPTSDSYEFISHIKSFLNSL